METDTRSSSEKGRQIIMKIKDEEKANRQKITVQNENNIREARN